MCLINRTVLVKEYLKLEALLMMLLMVRYATRPAGNGVQYQGDVNVRQRAEPSAYTQLPGCMQVSYSPAAESGFKD